MVGFWHGVLIGLVPGFGQFSILGVAITWDYQVVFMYSGIENNLEKVLITCHEGYRGVKKQENIQATGAVSCFSA